MHILIVIAALTVLEGPSAPDTDGDSLGPGNRVAAGIAAPPGLFLVDRRQDCGGGDPLFDLPSWLSDMIDGELIPDLPDFQIRISTRRLRLGYTLRF